MANFITRNIPNTLTCGNLVSGCIATVMALGGDARYALIWIIIGAVFDFFDGDALERVVRGEAVGTLVS